MVWAMRIGLSGWALLLLGAAAGAAEPPRVLFLTHSAGYRHAVVTRPDPETLALAEEQLRSVAGDRLVVDCTQDCGAITRENLARYAAVVFYTTGALPIDKDALVDFVRAGGGFVGIHPATDTLYKFADYGGMVGGYFNGHPWHEQVTVRVEDGRHRATRHLGNSFEITDEIYQFRDWERKRVRVLLSLDPKSVDLTKPGVRRTDQDFALAWCKPFGRGRVFYTALGHRPEVWKDERFLRHVVGGLEWTTVPRDEDGFEAHHIVTAPLDHGKHLLRFGEEEVARIDGNLELSDLKEGRLRELSPNASAYHVLFDGTSKDGWKMCGPGAFELKDGVLTTRGGMGMLWHERELTDFILMLEWRVGRKEDNSGVFVRFPDPGDDPWVAVNRGYEFQVCDAAGPKHRTGSAYSFQDARSVPTKPVGEWNHYEIQVVGQRYTVWINGKLVNVFDGERSRKGHIGLQNHDDKSRVQYRNIRVVELD
jgi:type 1 glutamine amidotransferase